MNYTRETTNGQLEIGFDHNQYLSIPSFLDSFSNTYTTVEKTKDNRQIYYLNGILDNAVDNICPDCGHKMYKNNHLPVNLRHIPVGSTLSEIKTTKLQLTCPICKHTKTQDVNIQAKGHRITKMLHTYVIDLLSMGTYNNREVAYLSGLDENTIKSIDKERLLSKYTHDGKTLIKPSTTTTMLGIDEFKLHNNYRYATHIIDLATGHVLWISYGKKKQVVYDFINHVGLDWMDNVEAVACDMNSDFQEAFEEMCPHIQPVYDYFHIVKNFNDKVISEIRKDEQSRLIKEGNIEGAKALKKTKYILTSSRTTLEKNDNEVKDNKNKDSLFKKPVYTNNGGRIEKYERLIQENKLLFTIDLIKEKLTNAYGMKDEVEMADAISDIMDICTESKNRHLIWFRNLLDAHFEGIIAHATYKISSSKIEGINNKIKTLRRQAYGYNDDEYFFLKIFDITNKT